MFREVSAFELVLPAGGDGGWVSKDLICLAKSERVEFAKRTPCVIG